MRRIFISLALAISLVPASIAQITTAEKQLKDVKKPEELGWKKGITVNISTAQTSLTNWVAGGQNSISVNSLLNAQLSYAAEKYVWENMLDMGYGLIKQGKKDFFKSDDKVEFNTKLGVPVSEKLKISSLINFKSQMTAGYVSPDDLTLISDLLSPAYLLGAVGIDAKWMEGLSVFIAPVTGKMTLVQNPDLVAAGSFGLDPGKGIRAEFGGYIRSTYTGKLGENITLQNKVDLFSNYLDQPQFIDVNWDVLVLFKFNKFLTASINTQLIYDHDILIGKDTNDDGLIDETKPRIQFKEILGLGLSFTF